MAAEKNASRARSGSTLITPKAYKKLVENCEKPAAPTAELKALLRRGRDFLRAG